MRKPYHLNAQFVRTIGKPGFFGDGRGGLGLELRVHRTASGEVSKSWRQRIAISGKRTMVGLGCFPFVTLEDARKLAVINKAKTLQGIDPRTDEPVQHVSHVPKPKGPTFREAAEAVIELNREQWRKGSTTEAYWRRSLLGLPFEDLPVSAVSSADIIATVRPIWNKLPRKAADQLRFIRAAIRWSIGNGHRQDDPSAAVRDALPKQRRQTKHYPALPPAEIPGAMRKLETCTKGRTPFPRLAIRFCWLTACRPGEVTKMRHEDISGSEWTQKAETTKSGKRAFVVPLTKAARAIIDEAARVTGKRSGLVFPNTVGKRIDGATLKRTLRLCGIRGTVHGTSRSGFRVWSAETKRDRYLSEMVLNHDIGSAVEQAYQRSDLFEQRREIMQEWSEYLTG